MKTVRTEQLNEGRETHDFGVRDDKGRAVGCYVAFSVQVFEQNEEATSYSRVLEPGTYYCWAGQATRAGEMFGASQSWNRCTTEAERHAAVAKYLASARARAVKKFAKP